MSRFRKGVVLFLFALLVTFPMFAAESTRTRVAKKGRSKSTASKQQAATRDMTWTPSDEAPRAFTAGAAKERKDQGGVPSDNNPNNGKKPLKTGPPVERQLVKASRKVFDLRALPRVKPVERDRPEHEDPPLNPITVTASDAPGAIESQSFPTPVATAAAPAPIINFDGLDRLNWGSGSPPDTNGDVGPTYYIQSVNSSVGVYDKATGANVTAFTFNTLMSQGNFGNQCDNQNFGDPVVLYDTFEDRWILSDFAFTLDGGNNVNPPEAFQCFAVSINGDPVSGGWNFYSIRVTDGLNDYPKLGVWPDGIYMSANMFGYPSGAAFQGARVWAFNKAQMYAGSPTVQVVTFDIGTGDFAVMPSNARLQTGTPPAGRPNLFISTWNFLNAVTVYKFHVDWNSPPLSTFTGPDVPLAATSWPNAAVGNAPQSGTANLIDVLQIRAMVQNQYTNFGGVESLWVPHTVRRGNTTGFAAPRWYQVDVTGGTVAANLPQATTWDPDAANVMHRFMPSLALDRAGNLALGYTTSSSTTFPSLKYAGRLAADPINTFSQTEQTLFAGTASQTTSTRWGDYSSMTLDPDGCTFWYTNEYANPLSQASNQRWLTRIGSFKYPSCTPVGAGGTISGTVTAAVGGAPIQGALVSLGSRSTTTDASGAYQFTAIPAGTYPSMSAAAAAFITATAASQAVTDGGTTTQNFALSAAPQSGCLTDTTQADFFTGDASSSADLTTSPGDIAISNAAVSDQANTAGTTTGTGFGTPAWTGQTFIAGVTGVLAKADIQLFCNGCGATPPNLTLSVRATSAGLPTGADLASTTISGSLFASGATTLATGTFASPATLTAGTQYALILRPVSAPAGSGYFWIRSSPNTYNNGSRVLSADSGATWSADTTRDYNFRTYMQTGYAAAADWTSAVKDSNPSAGLTPIWSTLSWTATTPASTAVKFQVAGSNNVNGPFSFVGPDGTAATFFTTSPAQVSPLYGFRYAKYKVFLTTANPAATPLLNDATLCFNDVDCSAPIAITPSSPSVCQSSTGNTASGPAGATSYSWSITNGVITGGSTSQTVTFTAGASGSVGLTLNIVEASGCHKSASSSIPIDAQPAAPTISVAGDQLVTVGGGAGTFTLTFNGQTTGALAFNATAGAVQAALNSLPSVGGAGGTATVVLNGSTYTVTFGGTLTGLLPLMSGAVAGGATVAIAPASVCESSSNQASGPNGATSYAWSITNGTITGGATSQTVTWTAPFNGTATLNLVITSGACTSPQASASFGIRNLPTVPTISADTNGTGTQDQACPEVPLTLHANGATGATSYQWYKDIDLLSGETNSTYQATGAATYYVEAVNSCGATAKSAGYVVQNPTPHSPFISFRNQDSSVTTLNACAGQSVIIDSDSATGIQWYKDNVAIPGANSQSYTATQSGVYTAQLNALGCHSQFGRNVTVTFNPLPATPTITPGGPTTFCAGGSVTLTSSSATGNQWMLNGNPIGGATSTTYNATASGSYTVVVTDGNSCSSAPSAATVVTVNPLPATPTITPGGPTTFCAGGSVTLTSSSASGNQWYLNGNPIGGATSNTYNATASGSYTVVVTDGNGCSSASSAATVVSVNSLPAAANITAGGPTTFCSGGSVTLSSSSASGNQWYLDGNPIGGATGQQYVATTGGSYTTIIGASGCSSAPSNAIAVTVNFAPSAPILSAGGPTAFCAGGSVTLTSSNESGNQWYLNGNPIGGATGASYVASVAGDYTVVATSSGCSSAPSAATTVTVNPLPSATITAPATVVSGSTGNAASVANAGAGATYNWSITNGTITGGTGTSSITFTAGAVGTLTLNVTVTTAAGCSDAKSANVNVSTAIPPVTVTSVVPPNGSSLGGTAVTISGTGFASGASVTFGGTAGSNVVVVNATTITAKTPAHAAGAVNVTVTNTDTGTGTLNNGFTYNAQRFDPNGDHVIDPSDIFYLVNYLYLGGPAPMGAAGMISGDANGDGVVDPSDIFYAVHYLFSGGPQPSDTPRRVASSTKRFAGAVSFGTPTVRGDERVVPVIVTMTGTEAPQALSLAFRLDQAQDAAVRRTSDAAPLFDIKRQGAGSLAWLIVFDEKAPLVLDAQHRAVVGELVLPIGASGRIAFDESLTLLADRTATAKAIVSDGSLRLSAITIGSAPARPQAGRQE